MMPYARLKVKKQQEKKIDTYLENRLLHSSQFQNLQFQSVYRFVQEDFHCLNYELKKFKISKKI